MKRNLTLLGLLCAVMLTTGCAKNLATQPYNEGINVIPVPEELTVTDTVQRFSVTGNTAITIATTDFQVPADYLAAKINASTGYTLATKQGEAPASNFIHLVQDTTINVNNEGYLLAVTAQGATITAKTPQGAFYGVQTLLQLLPAEIESPEVIKNAAWNMPLVEIKDQPRFRYRGLMLDICRHFESVEFIKKQLDVLAMFKINRFHWHLTDDQAWRIEIKKYPKLTEMGAVRTEGDGAQYGPFFYTQEQIKEVVAYATERYIDVIPEIEMPGHAMAALIGYPEFSCTGGPFKQPRIIWGVEDEVFCPGKEATFKFLQDVIDEVAPLFPSEYFHIGADECPKVRWEKCPDCQARIKSLGLKSSEGHSAEEKLQSYVVTRMGEYLTTKGKKLIGWDEILEGGLAPSATVMSWRGTTGGIAAANLSHDVIMTPGSEGLYIDQHQGAAEVEPVTIGGQSTLKKVYSYDPIPASLPADKEQYILGAQCNMWTEYRLNGQHMEYMIYPRIVALAEATWSPASQKDFDKFSKRIENAFVRMDYHGINYHIPMPEGVLTTNVAYTTDSTELTFTNTRDLTMVYTLDGQNPTANSTVYAGPFKVSGSGEVRIASMLLNKKLSPIRVIPFESQTLSPASTDTTAKKQGARLKITNGLYTNNSYNSANFETDTIVTKLHEGRLWDMNKPSVGIFEGFIALPEDGVYTFTTDMDELWIDDVQVIANNKLSRHYKNKTQKALATGKHTYKLVFNNMIKDGWPNNWNSVGFMFKAPSADKWTVADGELLTY